MAKNHSIDKNKKCKNKVVFSVTQSVMLMLQKSTQLQTHEIMKILIDQYEQIMKDYELDPNDKSTGAEWRSDYWGHGNKCWHGKEKRIKKHFDFPNTKVTLSCNLTVYWCAHEGYDLKPGAYNKKPENTIVEWKSNTNVIKVNFIMPQTKLYFDAESIGEMMLEGELFDVSDDIKELKKKDTVTPAEKRAKEEAKKKAKEAKQLAKIRKKQSNGKDLTATDKRFLKNIGEPETESN